MPDDAGIGQTPAWVEHWNENPTPFVWTKTADEILDKLARYCAAVTNTEYDGAST